MIHSPIYGGVHSDFERIRQSIMLVTRHDIKIQWNIQRANSSLQYKWTICKHNIVNIFCILEIFTIRIQLIR